jgi:hypothetical protein
MTELVLLADMAHCRFGDKGNTGLFVLIPYQAEEFELLVANVTPERVSQHFGNISLDQLTFIPCPHLGALVIIIRGSLQGGVTQSLALDAHGKTQSGYLLGMRLPWHL